MMSVCFEPDESIECDEARQEGDNAEDHDGQWEKHHDGRPRIHEMPSLHTAARVSSSPGDALPIELVVGQPMESSPNVLVG